MRDDISDKIVHLTKGTGHSPAIQREQALNNLVNILTGSKLIGGTGFIKGSHRCVCFSEAPIGKLSQILAAKDSNNSNNFKYQPYGLIFEKRWLYEKGGRPVIYGPDSDYEKLPDEMKYRHVRFAYSPYVVDLTWEREWRIKADQLYFDPPDVTIVVPDRLSKEALISKGHTKWHYIALSDLGVRINPL